MTASIFNQTWTRHIHDSWCNGNGWRTDIPSSVLFATYMKRAQFLFDDGSRFEVPVEELRRALANCPTRRAGTIVGPFNVHPAASAINGHVVSGVRQPPVTRVQLRIAS